MGRQFRKNVHNYPLWVKTSYNTQGGKHTRGGTPRGNYAGIGMIYDEDNDLFLPKNLLLVGFLEAEKLDGSHQQVILLALTAEQTPQKRS